MDEWTYCTHPGCDRSFTPSEAEDNKCRAHRPQRAAMFPERTPPPGHAHTRCSTLQCAGVVRVKLSDPRYQKDQPLYCARCEEARAAAN
jgi:hypothetical protein